MALPDKKLFPDYYKIIPELICLNMINVSDSRCGGVMQYSLIPAYFSRTVSRRRTITRRRRIS